MSGALHIATTPWSWSALDSAQALCRQAEQAEALGLHSLWLPENHFSGGRAIPSPITLLAAVAARTTRIKLGTTSYLLPIRNPILAAEEIAVLDRLSCGRVILGVGRGIQPEMFEAFAVATADKRTLFQRHLEIMLEAWRGEPVVEREDGKPVLLSPLPAQQPSPPIWVAAFGPLALKQAASLGLPYLASPIESLDTLADNYRMYHEHMSNEGLSRQEVVPVMRTMFVSDSEATTRALRARLDSAVPPAMREKAAGIEQWSVVGDRSYVRDRLVEYRERLGVSHVILRGGLPGIEEAQEVRSQAAVLELAAAL
ncbi:MAG: LLM class flavin-dependent oxidoreductase [Halioglobus sp.]|nr:LLM class flavin-dependent oxidoreductase [Halioglobus sp.]